MLPVAADDFDAIDALVTTVINADRIHSADVVADANAVFANFIQTSLCSCAPHTTGIFVELPVATGIDRT